MTGIRVSGYPPSRIRCRWTGGLGSMPALREPNGFLGFAVVVSIKRGV
jgi:hypothetical protein